ncbi:MAG: threonylcarbamoyl-AMP synthase [Deltaproteobacteria bacterium]|nr:threonylcarbamoyl-AMP synthase [Deltaproteobacteria bacterium]
MAHSTGTRIKISRGYPEPGKITRAVEVLNLGGIIAYPTDTTYGIGCSIFEKKAIDRVLQLKGLPADHLMSFICPDLADLPRYAQVENEAYRTMRRLLPGPYTFVLRATPEVPKILQSKRMTVGIRVPDDQVCLAIARGLGKPIISTSTRVGEKRLFDPDEIELHMGHGIDLLLDAGPLERPLSSVVDLTGPYPVVLREGAGDLSWIAN